MTNLNIWKVYKKVMANPVPDRFIIGERFNGIVNTVGKKANKEQNWGYYAKDQEGHNCILLYCNPDVYTIIDIEVLEQIRTVNDKQVSWFLMSTGYIGCHTRMNDTKTCLTLHQYLMDHYGHGKGGPSIDHINRNKLDNRLINLRITTQSIQNENRDKVSRHKNAKDLPDEITKDLPKFVVYYREKVSENVWREFFTVEGHPLQKMKEKKIVNSQTNQLSARRWATTKSNKISIVDKLEQAILYLEELHKLTDDSEYKIKIDIKKGIKTEEKEEKDPYVPENVIIIEEIKEIIEKKDEIQTPKQWKTKQIYDAIQSNQAHLYKQFCEENNESKEWLTSWPMLLEQTKGSKEDAEKAIKEFINNLRRIRHNTLCASKSDVVEREDREQWPATTVVKAFLEGKMDKFKAYTETHTSESLDDPKWIKRWSTFIESLNKNRDNALLLKELCSKFMTAQRTKKYRLNKKE